MEVNHKEQTDGENTVTGAFLVLRTIAHEKQILEKII